MSVAGAGWELHIRDAGPADSLPAYSCVAWETLTGQRRRSLPAHITVSGECFSVALVII